MSQKMTKFTSALTAIALSAGLATTAFAEDLKIGMIVTLSGPPGALGKQASDGFALALEQKGGKLGGQTVQMFIEDDELKPDVALLKATNLIEREEVDIIVGTIFSNMLQAIFKPIVESETFLISPNAGPSTFAGKNCNPFFFVTSYQNNQNSEVAGLMANAQGYENVFLMVPNYQAGRDNVAGFKSTFKGNVTSEAFTPLGHQDFSAELAQISTSGSDALFTFMPGGMGVRLVKQFAGAGLRDNMDFMSVFTTDETTLPGQKTDAVDFLAAGNWAPDMDSPGNKAFVEAFEAKYGYIPGGYAMQAYDTAMLIDSAVAKVGGDMADKDAVREALRAADFQSLRGDFAFSNNHYPVQDFHMLKVVERADGKFHTSYVETMIEDYADSFKQDCAM